MAKRKYKNGDLVSAVGCEGSARIESFIGKYGVYLLDAPLRHKYVAKDIGSVVYVPFRTFEEEQLIKTGE